MSQAFRTGVAQARHDRHQNSPARYRVQAGVYQFRTLGGTWMPADRDSTLEIQAKAYLEAFWSETLYAC